MGKENNTGDSYDCYEAFNRMMRCLGIPPYTPLEFEDTTTQIFEQEESDLSNYGECLFGGYSSAPYVDVNDQMPDHTQSTLEATHGQSSGDCEQDLNGRATVLVDAAKVQVRKQRELTLTIGYGVYFDSLEDVPDYISNFEEGLIEEVCELCGGCTALSGDGYWKPDAGTTRKDRYSAPTEQEYCLTLRISCEEDKTDAVYESLRDAVKRHKDKEPLLNIEWVHCIETATVGRHFRC